MSAVTVREKLCAQIDRVLADLHASGSLPGDPPAPVRLQPPKQASHGDFSCAAALALAKSAKKNPRAIGQELQEALGDAGGLLAKTELAGPGFLNLFVAADAWRNCLDEILAAGGDYIRTATGNGRAVLVEFVSANPTGPLHIAHGRGAVTGDIIARLLDAAGYRVETEYYVNDLGNQIDIMARSIHLRYGELHGRALDPPEDFYPGEYLIDVARDIAARDGERYLDAPESEWLELFGARGVEMMVARIKSDLHDFGIEFDRFVSEKELTARVGMHATLEELERKGVIYVQDGKRWFRSTDFGDDKDRVVVRDDGRTTYFASDIAYHHDKLQRGFDTLINVWGADHGGYIERVQAGIAALGYANDPLEIILVQMVHLSRGSEVVRMGKRLGTAVWLSDVVAEAGRDATRYFFAMRRTESQLDFDIELATKKSLDNPVYYAQMGHARMCSIQRRADEAGVPPAERGPGALDALTLPEELGLIETMARAPDVVAQAASEREPHQVVHYLRDLIGQFHSYYTQYSKTEKVISDSVEKTRARLLLCRGLRQILKALLEEILGVSAPAEMYLEEPAGIPRE